MRGRVTALTHKIRTNLLKDVQQYGWLRSSLAGPWNLIRTWEQLEPVQHHPPMPLMVVYALAITAQLWKWPRMAVALILAIYGSLRPAEIIGLRRRIWHCRGITSTTKQRCDTERLLYTTCSGHPGAASWILDRRRSALDTWPEIWNGSWAAFKLRFDALQTEVLEGTPFLPSSLRPGAATFLFRSWDENPPRLQWRGRWKSGSLFACRKLMCKSWEPRKFRLGFGAGFLFWALVFRK